ncbi:MAG: hypothetical protein U0R50_05220 [Gaiellales bacterium]
MKPQRRFLWAGAAVALGLATSVATAANGDEQHTNPPACHVLSKSRVDAALGGHAVAHEETYPIELPEADHDVNHFYDHFENKCAYAVPTDIRVHGITVLSVEVYERNASYSGGGKDPWTPQHERNILASLGGGTGGKGYVLVDNDKLAAKRHQPWLAGEDVMLLYDRRTHGQGKAILGTDPDEDTWFAITVYTKKRNALDILAKATRGLLSH